MKGFNGTDGKGAKLTMHVAVFTGQIKISFALEEIQSDEPMKEGQI